MISQNKTNNLQGISEEDKLYIDHLREQHPEDTKNKTDRTVLAMEKDFFWGHCCEECFYSQ